MRGVALGLRLNCVEPIDVSRIPFELGVRSRAAKSGTILCQLFIEDIGRWSPFSSIGSRSSNPTQSGSGNDRNETTNSQENKAARFVPICAEADRLDGTECKERIDENVHKNDGSTVFFSLRFRRHAERCAEWIAQSDLNRVSD